jgi:alpha-glucosidase
LSTQTPQWWQNAVCYQIYPRSYADSQGDGIGDLAGITRKLDYLQWLGIDALWVSPFNPSPQFDWGYDVSDYRDVDPEYGTLADFDTLLEEAHQRGIRILLDLVLNHTSDQHPWFQASRSSRDNPYRDWYIWRDGRAGTAPNDWEALFGGSAWQLDETTGQYYYHFFFPEQPDLNWRNPEVQQAILDTMRFWFDRGVDGFRLDAITHLFEAENLPDSGSEVSLEKLFFNIRMGVFDAGFEKIGAKIRYQQHLPENHSAMQALRRLANAFPGRVLLGETMDPAYYGGGRDALHSVFNFDIIKPSLDAGEIRAALLSRLTELPDGAWECNTIGNHDRRRSYSVFADGQHDDLRARAALGMTMFLQGTPVFYYGEEIGMQQLPPRSAAEFRDELAIQAYHSLVNRYGIDEATAFENVAAHSCRDGCRTPMQWDASPNAGFTSPDAVPWLPVHPNHQAGVNVADQQADPHSLLHFFRKLVQVRKKLQALRIGTMAILPDTGDLLVFWRELPDQACLVVLNFSSQAVNLPPAAHALRLAYRSAPEAPEAGRLAPYEIWIGVRVEKN